MKIDLDKPLNEQAIVRPDDHKRVIVRPGMTVRDYAWIRFAEAAITKISGKEFSEDPFNAIRGVCDLADMIVNEIERRSHADGD